MSTMIIRNRSSKISPGGVITLPLSARRALAMMPGKGARVTVALEQDALSLRLTGPHAGVRVSPKGQMELVGEPRALLERGGERHYWLEVNDESRIVTLHPYTA